MTNLIEKIQQRQSTALVAAPAPSQAEWTQIIQTATTAPEATATAKTQHGTKNSKETGRRGTRGRNGARHRCHIDAPVCAWHFPTDLDQAAVFLGRPVASGVTVRRIVVQTTVQGWGVRNVNGAWRKQGTNDTQGTTSRVTHHEPPTVPTAGFPPPCPPPSRPQARALRSKRCRRLPVSRRRPTAKFRRAAPPPGPHRLPCQTAGRGHRPEPANLDRGRRCPHAQARGGEASHPPDHPRRALRSPQLAHLGSPGTPLAPRCLRGEREAHVRR